MELFRWGPAGVGQAAAEHGQVIADLWRWVAGDEEAFVHGWRVGLSERAWCGWRFLTFVRNNIDVVPTEFVYKSALCWSIKGMTGSYNPL